MDYQLALKLKAAGFPQGPNPAYNVEEMTHVRCPNLEEVIEACGDITIKLWINGTGKGSAVQLEGESLTDVEWYPTPLEAVSNLYIALNTK